MLQLVVSIATALAAVVALALTVWQTRVSNRQALFEKRLDLWLEACVLLELYDDFRQQFGDGSESESAIRFLFTLLTNSSWLCELPGALDLDDEKSKKALLTELETMRGKARRAEFVFDGDVSEGLSAFFRSYEELLSKCYAYGRLIGYMTENKDKLQWTTREEAEKAVGEPRRRKSLFEALANLDESCGRIRSLDSSGKIRRQMKLC